MRSTKKHSGQKGDNWSSKVDKKATEIDEEKEKYSNKKIGFLVLFE